MPLELSIVTPEAEALKVTCDEVAVPGINGEVGLLPEHVPLITALRPGILTVWVDGKRSVYAVSNGFAELEGRTLTVLTDGCEHGSAIDVEQAKDEAAQAERALAEISEADDDYLVHRTRLLRAQARLTAASLQS